MNTLQIDNLTFSYQEGVDSQAIFKNNSLTVADSRIVGLVGVNGSGKSTLLKLIKGELTAQKGEIFVCGTDVKQRPNITFITQKAIDNVFPKLTVFENYMLFHGRKMSPFSFYDYISNRHQCKHCVKAAGMNLENRLDEQVRFLSGGQQQALGILLACDTESPILLMDEPTASLDIFVAEKVLKLATDEVYRKNGFLIFTSHNLHDIIKYTDHIVVLRRGEAMISLNNNQRKLNIEELRHKMQAGNPWELVSADDYEGHMRDTGQYDFLNTIFREQLSLYDYHSVCILGIGCGNGLEYIKSGSVVYGFDINKEFLTKCGLRFSNKKFKLILEQKDLKNEETDFPLCDLLICNLVLEFIGVTSLSRIVKKVNPKFVSVLFQIISDNKSVVSPSSYSQAFEGISSLTIEVNEEQLSKAMKESGLSLFSRIKYYYSPQKSFIQINYSK